MSVEIFTDFDELLSFSLFTGMPSALKHISFGFTNKLFSKIKFVIIIINKQINYKCILNTQFLMSNFGHLNFYIRNISHSPFNSKNKLEPSKYYMWAPTSVAVWGTSCLIGFKFCFYDIFCHLFCSDWENSFRSLFDLAYQSTIW